MGCVQVIQKEKKGNNEDIIIEKNNNISNYLDKSDKNTTANFTNSTPEFKKSQNRIDIQDLKNQLDLKTPEIQQQEKKQNLEIPVVRPKTYKQKNFSEKGNLIKLYSCSEDNINIIPPQQNQINKNSEINQQKTTNCQQKGQFIKKQKNEKFFQNNLSEKLKQTQMQKNKNSSLPTSNKTSNINNNRYKEISKLVVVTKDHKTLKQLELNKNNSYMNPIVY